MYGFFPCRRIYDTNTLVKMDVEFPLPKASQQYYTRWFHRTVPSGQLKDYKILWVGVPLSCRFASDLKDVVTPENVFILKKNTSFAYALIDSMDQVHRLPKKYFTICFPGVQISSVPENNMIKIQLTRRQSINVPYIPDAFLQSKRQKTSRVKRKRSHSISTTDSGVENIDFDTKVPEWHILGNEQNRESPVKREILVLLRSIIDFADTNHAMRLPDPFEGCESLSDIKNDEGKTRSLKVIASFISHYCRAELGCHSKFDIDFNTVQSWSERLHEMRSV